MIKENASGIFEYRQLYYCDPSKNHECSKSGCILPGQCYCTTNPIYAETDASGKPIAITQRERLMIQALEALPRLEKTLRGISLPCTQCHRRSATPDLPGYLPDAPRECPCQIAASRYTLRRPSAISGTASPESQNHRQSRRPFRLSYLLSAAKDRFCKSRI